MTIRVLNHRSDVLAQNLCGDPADRDLWVYLPPDYETSSLRYPVLWCLTGFTGTGSMAVTGNRWAPGLNERLDRLISDGCPPVIVAFPDCFTRWGGSQYLNSEATGRYEDYLCDELVPFVDGEFRTIQERDARGVFGKSSGGYGAIRLGMVRHKTFGALACHSGDMAFAYCYLPGFAGCAAALARAGSLADWVEEFEKTEKKKGSEFDAINTIGMAAAYSPDPDAPFGFRLPYDAGTGELIPEIWERWRQNDPVVMIQDTAHQAALKSLRLLFLDCGDRDEWRLQLGLRSFIGQLKSHSIPHEVEEFPDNHRSISYRYDVSVPKLAAALLSAG